MCPSFSNKTNNDRERKKEGKRKKKEKKGKGGEKTMGGARFLLRNDDTSFNLYTPTKDVFIPTTYRLGLYFRLSLFKFSYVPATPPV